jgi:hypothetical protein
MLRAAADSRFFAPALLAEDRASIRADHFPIPQDQCRLG